MTTPAAGIWNSAAPHGLPLAARPQSGAPTGNSGDGSSTSSASISANDFLTLLVTELQNQDPTAQTDPNAYVNQLVAVNSLEQLININQTLSSAAGSGAAPGMVPNHLVAAESSAQSQHPAAAGVLPHTPGNLAIPRPNPAAESVGHALSGRAR